MRHAFIASVPFTLIEAIHCTIVYDLDADVYITKSFTDAENVADRLKKVSIFKNVYLCENVLLDYPITVQKCINVVKNGRRIVKELKHRSYDYGYYNNSGWLINSIFYTGFLKGNKKCKQRFIEHGYNTLLNSYSDKSLLLRLFIIFFGFKCMDGSMIEALYMFEPQLLRVQQYGEKIRMPKMNKDDDRFRTAINQAFGFDPEKNEFLNKQIIIMEEPALKVEYDKDEFWRRIIELIDTSRAIIKPHPRMKESALKKYGIVVSSNNSMPWEVIAANTDMDKKIQLCIFSGSCLHPKYCMDVESRVVMLYKLLPVDYTFLGKDILSFSNDIKNLYEDQNKFFVPNSFDELRDYFIKIGVGREMLK